LEVIYTGKRHKKSEICQHIFFVIQFAKKCTVISTAERPLYSQFNFRVWKENDGEQNRLMTSS